MHFVIGDIHGEHTKLKLLVANIRALDKNAELIFIGDYVNKGENPYLTLIYIQQLIEQHRCTLLRGNHEYYWEMLNSNNDEFAMQLLKYGGKKTMDSFQLVSTFTETKKIMFEQFQDIFNSLTDWYVCGNYVITHSGIPLVLYNTEINKIERKSFLFNRYDFISNPNLYFDKKVIFGHTGFYSPYYDLYKIGIDTAACYIASQPLSAFCIEEEFFIDSKNNYLKLSNINQNYCPAIPRVSWQ